jgi:hypothetical protein
VSTPAVTIAAAGPGAAQATISPVLTAAVTVAAAGPGAAQVTITQ